MTSRDLAAVAYKAVAAWLFVTGVIAVLSALLTWAPNVARYGQETTSWQLAAAAAYIPIGALAWLASDSAARWSFPQSESATVALDRSDLYAFASVLIGLYLLADALPQVVYFIVTWRSAQGTAFWKTASTYTTDTGLSHWVALKGQVAATVTKAILGLILLSGPSRITAMVRRVRRELSGSLAETDVLNGDETSESVSRRA